MTINTCDKCKWFEESTRECHKNPPAASMVFQNNNPTRGILENSRKFPVVNKTDWCGGFKRND